MSHWITTKQGNQIDLDWFKNSNNLTSAIKDYYKSIAIKALKLNARTEMYVKKEIRHSGKRFEGENISMITLPGDHYMMYIFTHSGGKIENARVTIVDAIDYDEIEAMEEFFDRRF